MDETKSNPLLFDDNISIRTILIAAIAVIFSILLVKQINIRYLLAPGPWGIPILGFYPFLRKHDHHIHLQELAKKYGDAYLISMLGRRYLHLNSSKAVRETFVTKADCFNIRPQEFGLFQYMFKDGVFYINGEHWHVMRKFVVQTMRELGIGAKEQLKDPLSISVKDTLKALEDSDCQPINMTHVFYTQCTEVIKRMILGDISTDLAEELNNAYLSCMPIPTMAHLFVGNIARYLVLNRVPGYNEMFEGKKKLVTIFYKILDDHKATFDPEYPRDMIDIYLREKQIREEKKSPHAVYFTDSALVATLLQIYGDGGSSVGSVVALHLKFLAEHPETQEDLHEEIKREIGTEREPTYEDKVNLPLMNSVIKEIERIYTSITPTLSTLQSSYDTTVSGIYVPKGTIVITNHYSIHHDPAVYKDPDSFNAKRFLIDEENKRPKEELPIFFGVGKRSCVGESLVLTELFVFLTSIIQRFKVRLVQTEIANAKQELDLNCIIIATPR